MTRLALRASAVATGGVLAVTLLSVPAQAADVDVSLSPATGSVGDTVKVLGADLADVDTVTFGTSRPATVVSASGGEVDVVVPPDATTGVVALGYSDASVAATDESFTVVPLPATASVSRSRAVVRFPGNVVIGGRLTAAGIAAPGQRARLQRAPADGTSWKTVRRAKTTDGNGVVRWTLEPRATADYRVVFPASAQYLGATSPRTRVHVRPLVLLHVPAVAPIYTRIALPGRVRPAPAGHARVILDQRVGGVWRVVDRSRTGDTGHFAFHVSFTAIGDYTYRVRRPADATHLKSRSTVGVVSAVKRTLRSGDTGPDVLALQKRLRTLHYDVGRADGHFGYDTLHAVVAFQKVQGIDRDGVVGPRVWRRLADPRVPHLRHPEAAATSAVEVDLTKQVVYYAVRGKVRAVIDASSGGGYYYTGSDGTTQRAITPTGHYSFLYKYDDADHWQHAPLGELYKPAYFRNDGYAIHGSNSIPPYPASHGCVRISVPAMDRFTDRFLIGMSVWVYRS
jgi:peptidoglycan hydrolase-like protein with peptidoglycan-binding domain